MSDWQPDLYLKFAEQRTRPAIDLAARIDKKVRTILDIGCGPGNSTLALRNKWPEAEITGLDSSAAMLRQAEKTLPQVKFIQRDAGQDLSDLGCFELVFANAVIQWIPRHSALIHRLFAMLSPGGILAVQVPYTEDMPAQRILRQMAQSPRWSGYFTVEQRTSYPMRYYYDIVSKLPGRSQLWQTSYLHVMEDYADIVSWYSATALRPYLHALADKKAMFLEEYEYNLAQGYHRQTDNKILFPFNRIFFTVEKTGAD